MLDRLIIALWFCCLALGIALLVSAKPCSLRYNNWTARFRERHPNLHPPPIPEMRELNIKIMAGIFRVIGMVFCATAAWLAFKAWRIAIP
jgi:hypothetical protein